MFSPSVGSSLFAASNPTYGVTAPFSGYPAGVVPGQNFDLSSLNF
jgi:hypothetical protein